MNKKDNMFNKKVNTAIFPKKEYTIYKLPHNFYSHGKRRQQKCKKQESKETKTEEG